ncbi:hypothetical protein BH23CYA1_BH23CYA1_07290 [soil metagenome]
MTAIASPEFVSLCRTQLRLLTQQMAESSAALYIADVADMAEQATQRNQSNFVPVASYPEPVDSWVANFTRATPWANSSYSGPLALPAAAEAPAASDQSATETERETHPETDPSADSAETHGAETHGAETSRATPNGFCWPDILHPEQQMVVPLVYTEVVVGLLVTVRPDRAWLNDERRHIEMVAESLAAGCVLERHNHWLQHQLSKKRSLQSRQSEIFHNLLHQFRNPLTAVSTFGQLLVRRLATEDPNQVVATGIVRESKRLRELVSHFDQAVAIGDADLTVEGAMPALLPAAQRLLAPGRLVPSGAGQGEEGQESRRQESRRQAAGNEIDAQRAEQTAADQVIGGAGLGQPLTMSAQYLPDIVEPILAVANIVATEKGVDLQAQVAADTPPVWGEEEALGEVVSNLVDNAIKYSLAGAQVWVQTGVSRVGERGHYQGIVVGDTGLGIPASDQAHLFERYYRGVQAHSDLPGTGLGLAIAQSLVQEMQGFIEVISPAAGTPWVPRDRQKKPGVGTVFIVWLLEVDR